MGGWGDAELLSDRKAIPSPITEWLTGRDT